MELIMGGAYQGKRSFAISERGVSEENIFVCTEDGEPDREACCVEHLERYVYYCVKNGLTPDPSFRQDSVLIGDDIFCGVVPVDPVERAWREETGRFYAALCRSADRVTRLFCGLPLKLK